MRIEYFIKSSLFGTTGMEWRDNIACVCLQAMNERKNGCTVSYANIYYEEMWFSLKGNNGHWWNTRLVLISLISDVPNTCQMKHFNHDVRLMHLAMVLPFT